MPFINESLHTNEAECTEPMQITYCSNCKAHQGACLTNSTTGLRSCCMLDSKHSLSSLPRGTSTLIILLLMCNTYGTKILSKLQTLRVHLKTSCSKPRCLILNVSVGTFQVKAILKTKPNILLLIWFCLLCKMQPLPLSYLFSSDGWRPLN